MDIPLNLKVLTESFNIICDISIEISNSLYAPLVRSSDSYLYEVNDEYVKRDNGEKNNDSSGYTFYQISIYLSQGGSSRLLALSTAKPASSQNIYGIDVGACRRICALLNDTLLHQDPPYDSDKDRKLIKANVIFEAFKMSNTMNLTFYPSLKSSVVLGVLVQSIIIDD